MPSVSATRTVVSRRLIVGLEIHVELATRSKMFTRAPNLAHPENFDAAPNSVVDPVVLALPGTLPVMNREAVEMSILVGMALHCQIARHSKWDRKNYFYPDLPKGYQISQYDQPLCGEGSHALASGKRIGIIRAHLEEDTGKLGHELPGGLPADGSLVDFNRAGTPLLEIVTAPDFESADEVVAFAEELRDLCRFLGVTEGILQRGHMRFEPNVNLALVLDDGSEVRTPVVEVKNLNSFRAVRGAIEHEAIRQEAEWMQTGRVMGPGAKSTRGWDDVALETVLQREKEDAHDYRYFPDPDLVGVEVDDAWLDRLRARMPSRPDELRARFAGWGLTEKDIRQLLDDPALSRWLREAHGASSGTDGDGYSLTKLLLNNVMKLANGRGCGPVDLGFTAAQAAGVVALRQTDAIGAQSVDALLEAMCGTPETPREVAVRLGVLQVRDDSALDAWVEAAITGNPQAAADVRGGKLAAIGRLVGAVMKESGGRANAKDAQARLLERLKATP
ncbi:MAG: Asp-tRNA(Asn)/Glu-tRNA(Gln) amidotransferase subunit GatB [Planctomycetota bacterium]|nr:Asp-tRNA(Asn)/Glu-tRNA(Gln) amidotransferase subunit GatB [Planctomycetota bacterium]MDA1105696.1 Asp-tRNA(Asn)/Glu-tRNA(Gln) amidotransferase subunit GatB [Planctomycetota bacterium]